MNYIVHRDAESKSVLQLGMTYRLTIRGLASVMQGVIKGRLLKTRPGTGSVTLQDLKHGIRIMNKVADHSTTHVTISYWEAHYALLVCGYLSGLSAVLTPRLKSMLREAVMIFSDCSVVNLRVAYLLPFEELEAEMQKIPVVVRHYRSIESKANLALGAYPISLTDAVDLLDAIKNIRTIKIELLRQALHTVTVEIRDILANIS